MTREEAYSLLCEHVQSISLRRHCLAVEKSLAFYAGLLGEDETTWAVTGLLHDFDYEEHPEEHPMWGMKLLESLNCEPVIIRAIGSHNDKTGIPRESPLEKHLFACDEITGFIAAVAYVRPSKSIYEVEVKSVLKKMKEKSFAAAVSRQELLEGAELIGLPFETHVQNIIDVMKKHAELLGVQGQTSQ